MLNIIVEGAYKPVGIRQSNGNVIFEPPVYEQRYSGVINVLQHELWNGKLKKIIDFGCGELKMFPLLKNVPGVEHIIAVDVDADMLQRYEFRVIPLISDHLRQREKPLVVDVYRGSIDTPHECLRDADAVIGIEIIEHVFPDIIENLPHNLFSYIHPKLIILTTPNYEFNIVFGSSQFPNGFRHEDHKFEWTREQFQEWALNLCERYPDYIVQFHGIGPGPEDTAHLGCVSQMAIFIRKDFVDDLQQSTSSAMVMDVETQNRASGSQTMSTKILEMNLDDQSSEIIVKTHSDPHEDETVHQNGDENSLTDNESCGLGDFQMIVPPQILTEENNNVVPDNVYHLLYTQVHPANFDDRNRTEKILDESKYHISRFFNMEEEYLDTVEDVYRIPLKDILDLIIQHTDDITELRTILVKNNYNINDENVLIISYEQSDNEPMEDDINQDVQLNYETWDDVVEEEW